MRVTGIRGMTRPGVGSFCEVDVVAGTRDCRDALEVAEAAAGIGLTRLCESGRSAVSTGVGGGVVVRETHSGMLVKRWLESTCWRAIAVLQAACTTTLARERMSLRRPLTSAATDACTMRSSSVEAGLVSACSPAREASAPREMGERASL